MLRGNKECCGRMKDEVGEELKKGHWGTPLRGSDISTGKERKLRRAWVRAQGAATSHKGARGEGPA